MNSKNIRKEALRLEKLFQETISVDYSDEKYGNISEIVTFMKKHTENLQQLSYDKVIFIIGSTGAGKSTLMNYLYKEDNLFVSGCCRMYAKESIADIGEGTTGSTTLFPNAWKHSEIEGVFIDCAGDFDSRGVIIEAINSKVKTHIANSVKSAKILFVIPEASLGAEGAYGKIFREALDKNAKFFNDVNYFREHIVLVISHANRSIKSTETIDALLQNIMQQFSLSNYTETVKHVIEQKNIVTFCKPSDEATSGSLYKAPAWKTDERQLIINKITAVSFIEIPQKDFFNISSSLEVKEQMDKALTIVKKKAVQILINAVEEAIRPKITVYATELKLFADFLNALVTKNISACLEHYIKYLNYNDFLPISLDPEMISKLTGELKYLESFTKDQQNSDRGSYDWKSLTGIPSLLHNIRDEVVAIINKSSDLFTEFGSYNNLKVIGAFSDSENVKKLFKGLHDKHKEKCNVESLKCNTNSKYYYDEEVQEFDYMEREAYTKMENYEEDVPYTRIETFEKDVPYTKTEYYTDQELDVVDTVATHFLTLGLRTVVKGVFMGGDPGVYKTVQKSREVTDYKRVLEEKEVTDYKRVTKTREVTDYRDKPIYKSVTKRQFNESEYNEDIAKINDFITKLRENITEILMKMKLSNESTESMLSEDARNKVKMNTSQSQRTNPGTQDQFTTPFKDLYEQWKHLEYHSLFLNKPDMSLEINDMDQLLAQDIPLIVTTAASFALNPLIPIISSIVGGNPGGCKTVQKSREVTDYKRVLEEKEVTDYKRVTKTREVTDYRDKPIYKSVTKRQFNKSEYNEDITKIDDFITKLRENITEILMKMKLSNQNKEAMLSEDVRNKVKMNTSQSVRTNPGTQDQFTTLFKDLYEQWKHLEYQSLFLNKPDMSLDISNMEQLLAQDIPPVNA